MLNCFEERSRCIMNVYDIIIFILFYVCVVGTVIRGIRNSLLARELLPVGIVFINLFNCSIGANDF